MALNAGFDSADEFKEHLEEGIKKEKLAKAKDDIPSNKEVKTKIEEKDVVIHNVHILDASGSMDHNGKIHVALDGINEEVKLLKSKDDATYFQTFVSFSSRGDVIFHESKTKMKLVPKISISTRGMTALYEAIVVTLERIMTEKSEGEKTIVKIFTDGHENDSQYKYKSKVKEVIAKAESNDITVTFVGTKDDVMSVIDKIGIDESNTLTHNNTRESVRGSFVTSSVATTSFVEKVKKGEDVSLGFYKDLK